jgi:hypothetical protein
MGTMVPYRIRDLAAAVHGIEDLDCLMAPLRFAHAGIPSAGRLGWPM